MGDIRRQLRGMAWTPAESGENIRVLQWISTGDRDEPPLWTNLQAQDVKMVLVDIYRQIVCFIIMLSGHGSR